MRFHSVVGDDDIFHPPWPMWEDSAINSMKWGGDAKQKKNWVFEDPMGHGSLPDRMPVSYWKRPNVNQEETEWVLTPEEKPVDLVKHNSHLLKYKIMAWIITSIQCLEEVGRTEPFEVEHQSTSFVYNGGPNWKPWYHIYALAKVGKGTTHNLHLNRSGLYVVRLFYFGSWRCIAVDDHLPYDEDGELLLPITKNKYNLWPQILTKALLRIASLSWTSVEDVVDFSAITCLTGWTCYKLDCRLASMDDVWNAIQMNIIEKERGKEEDSPFCLTTPSQTCLNDSYKFYCTGNPKMKTIFLSLSKTENELPKISPAEEHLMCIMDASIKSTDSDIENLPLWKKLRWLKWAKHNKENLQSNVERNIKVYSAMRKHELPNPYTEACFASLTEKIVSGEIMNGNIKLLLYNEVTHQEGEKHEKDSEEYLTFNFSSLYAHIRELEVYYKSGNFKYSEDFNDLYKVLISNTEKLKGSNMRHLSKQTLNVRVTQTLVHDQSKPKYFFLYSQSHFCTNFFVSLSTCTPSRENTNTGYLACEEYNWKSRVMGKLLFSLWTYGTKTHFFRLGNSVQVCRFWCDLPTDYYICIKGNTPFEILNEESLYIKLSQYSQPVKDFGAKISLAFSQMRFGKLGTADHYSLINYFKKSFYPPTFNSLEADYQTELIDDFNEVFDECLAELIFEKLGNLLSAAACIEALRMLFNSEQLGTSSIEKFTEKEKIDFEQCRLEIIRNQKNLYSEMLCEKLKLFKREHQLAGAEEIELDRGSVNTSKRLKNGSLNGSKQTLVNQEDIAILDSPECNIELLRKILNKKKEYLHLYSFRNELDLKLQFHEYSGSTEGIPLHNWFIVTRLIVNVHSEIEVPCVIKVKTSYSKVTVVVFEIDTCKQVLCSFDVNNIYYLARKRAGYIVLVYCHPSEEMIKENLMVHWKIEMIGIDEGNILHYCYKTPLLCKPQEVKPLNIDVQSITGFYFPNIDNIIGRFQIKSNSSPVVTLYISLSRENVLMRVVIRGSDKEICVAEGRGVVMIPVALLDKSIAVKSTHDPDKFTFRGEIQLLGLWKLNKTESLFKEKLRDQPQRDVLSFDDFENYSLDDFQLEEEANEKEERADSEDSDSTPSNLAERRKVMKKKKALDSFNPDSEVDSDEISIFSRKEASPFGFLSYSPHWRISMILDEIDSEGTVLEHDDLVCKAYMMFTKSWEENDPGRAERAEEIRNEFLSLGRTNFMKMQSNPADLPLSDISECSIIKMKTKKRSEGQQSNKSNSEIKARNESKFRQRGQSELRTLAVSQKVQKKKEAVEEIKARSSKINEKLKLKNVFLKKLKSKSKKYSVMSTLRKFCLQKMKVRMSSSQEYGLNENDIEQLRSAGHGMISKPLETMKIKKCSAFRRTLQKRTFSSDSITSSSSERLSEEELHQEYPRKKYTTKTEISLPDIQPSISLLAKIPAEKHILPVSKLYKDYCRKLHERNVVKQKSAPNDKSITKLLLKKYQKPSGNAELSSFNLDIFEFDLTPKRPLEDYTIKEISEKSKKMEDLNAFVEEIVEPSLWYVSKQTMPEGILYTPSTFKKTYEFGKALIDENLKFEADDYISYLLETMIFNLSRRSMTSADLDLIETLPK